LAELEPGERAIGEGALDRADAALGVCRRDAFLLEASRVAGEKARSRQRVQPGVVLAAHEVQRPPVQPGDEERAVLGERTVDVRGAEAGGPRADREAGATRVL